MSRDDGTAQLSVGVLRQGKRNLFPFLFCLFRQTIKKSSVNNIIIALRFFFGLTENPVQKPEKSSASPPVAAGFFLPKLRRYSCEYVVFFCLNVSRDDGTAQLIVRCRDFFCPSWQKTCDPFGSRFIQCSSASYFPQGKSFMHRRCAS